MGGESVNVLRSYYIELRRLRAVNTELTNTTPTYATFGCP